ncbi:MAG: ABC transporter substrate-binding protein [Chloroflexi bacterium]|nr:ABC transporter substrate-binding protein [Chloroflexota bacterium]
MKAFAKLLMIAVVMSVLVACASPAAPTTAPAAPKAATVPAIDAAMDAWLKSAELGKYAPAKQDWAAIEAAAKKEGKVLVYANSSRIADVKKTFEKKYPGITLEGFDLGSEDSVLKIKEEQKAGAFTGDVLFSSSSAGDVVGDMLPKQMLWNFIPDTVASVYPKAASDPLLVSRYGVRVLAYNSELNKTCPVGNWWELTEPTWKGKIYIEDPLADASTMGIFATIVSHGKEFADAYKEKYGKDPVLDKDTPDAAWLWLKLFAKNKPMPQPGGDEVTTAIGSKGMKEAGIGFISYSKYRNVVKGTIVVEPCKGLKPVLGLQTASYLAIANRAPHPNAAKLFINYITSQEGFESWNVIGDYSPRTDWDSPKGAIPYMELGKVVWTVDESIAYKTLGKVRDFYAINVLK